MQGCHEPAAKDIKNQHRQAYGREGKQEKHLAAFRQNQSSPRCPGRQKKCYQCQRIRAAAIE